MKLAPLLLTVSLIANAALIGALAWRSPTVIPPKAAGATHPATRAVGADLSSNALRAALAAGDAAALEAAGLPADMARQLMLGRAFSRFGERMRATQTAATDGKWWQNRPAGSGYREEALLARRELSDAMLAAFGEDFGLGGGDGAQLSFLALGKRDALRRITQDYDEMMAKFSTSGVQLPSDREKLRLLRAERDRDIAALLTPAEFSDYELRTSGSAANLRARYGDAIESEDDFRKLFALQKAFDEKFPRDAFTGRITPEAVQQRATADRQMQDEMRAVLGDDKYAALRRAADSDLRNVDSLVSRLNLPADTTNRVASARDSYSTESQRISADPALTPALRREKIQELATRAKGELARTLGAEAAEAYGQRSPWVSLLQGGIAFSTNPKDSPAGALGGPGGQSVFPVMPAGAGGAPGATRQTVNIVSGGGAGGPTDGGAFFFNASPPQQRDNTQVISVVTGSPAPGDGQPPTTPPRTPPPGSPAPPPPR